MTTELQCGCVSCAWEYHENQERIKGSKKQNTKEKIPNH